MASRKNTVNCCFFLNCDYRKQQPNYKTYCSRSMINVLWFMSLAMLTYNVFDFAYYILLQYHFSPVRGLCYRFKQY